MKSINKRLQNSYTAAQYKIFEEQVTEITRQAIAMMLYGLSVHGYGTKRLQTVYKWTLDVLNLPKVFGKDFECMDAMQMLQDKHGINFELVNPKFQGFKEYYDEHKA